MTHMDQQSIEKAAESTFAKSVSRFLVPVMLAVIAYLGREMKAEVTAGIEDVQSVQAEQGKSLEKVSSDVRNVNTRLDEALIGRIRDLERRIEVIEYDHREGKRP